MDRISLQALECSGNILYPAAVCSTPVDLWAMQLQGTCHFVTNCSAVCDGACLNRWSRTYYSWEKEFFSPFQNVLMCWYRTLSMELTFRMLATVKLIYTTINHGRSLKRLLNAWDRNGSTSWPTPWQLYADDDDATIIFLVIFFTANDSKKRQIGRMKVSIED